MKKFRVVFTFQDNEKRNAEMTIEAMSSGEAVQKVRKLLEGIGAKGITVITANEVR